MTDPDVDEREVFARIYLRSRQFAAVIRPRSWIDPDDLVQEALARALAAGGFARLADPERYLRTVIFRVASAEIAKQRRVDEVLNRAGRSDDDREPGLPVSLLLAGLTPHDRALLYLVDVEGLPIREAAGVTGVRETAARMRLVRARRKARLLLEADDERNAP